MNNHLGNGFIGERIPAVKIGLNSKQTNRNRIYQLVYQQGSISKPGIAARLGISLPTVIQNVKSLQQEGLLKEGERLNSTGGRKAVSVMYEKNARFAIGTDITRDHISIALINLATEIIESVRIGVPYENTPRYYQELVRQINLLVAISRINPVNILGVGFSIPGILTPDGQMIIHSHALGVSVLPCSTFSRGLNYPAVLCNDANAAGFAELWQHKYRSDAILLSLSDTVGGAILLHDELYQGENQRGGEFGHMTLVPDGLPCYCGRKGCVDAYCSTLTLSQHTGGDLALFFQRLKTGDAELSRVWEQYKSWLATVINNLIVSFDCAVILGGYLGEFLENYVEELRTLVAERTTFFGMEDYVNPCVYKKDAAAVGAALLYVSPFIKGL